MVELTRVDQRLDRDGRVVSALERLVVAAGEAAGLGDAARASVTFGDIHLYLAQRQPVIAATSLPLPVERRAAEPQPASDPRAVG